MPWVRDSYQTILTRVRTDWESAVGEYPTAGVPLALARISASLAHSTYGHVHHAIAQFLPDIAEDATMIRWARLLGLQARAGSKATGTAEFTAATGATMEAGTRMKAGAFEFVTLADAGESGGVISVAVEAAETGSESSGLFGTVRLLSPVSGVDTEGAFDGATGSGTDPEDADSLRARLLYRIAHPSRGGAPGDYAAWALEVPGVLMAWEYPERDTAGEIEVRFVDEDESNPLAWQVPDSTRIALVQAHLDARAPSTTVVNVDAPTQDPKVLEVDLNPSTTETQAAVVEEVKALFLELEPGETLARSRILAAISEAAGETDHTLTSPASGDLVPASPDHLLTYGTLAFT